MNTITVLLAVSLVVNAGQKSFGQYHQIPDEEELELLIKISDKAFKKDDTYERYDTIVIIYYSDLGCDNIIEDKKLNETLFKGGIKLQYRQRRKCLFKKQKYLAAMVYYLDSMNKLTGYADGQAFIPASIMSTKHEKLIQFVIENELSNLFMLGCVDGSIYYAIDKNGNAVVIDESPIRQGEDIKVIPISELPKSH